MRRIVLGAVLLIGFAAGCKATYDPSQKQQAILPPLPLLCVALDGGVGEGCCSTDQDCAAAGAGCRTEKCNLDTRTCYLVSDTCACTSDSDCHAGVICNQDVCDKPQGSSTGTCTTVELPTCCILDSDCDDGLSCTTDHCVISTLTDVGTCTHTPVADPSCCETGSTCTVVAGCVKAECKNAGNPWDDCVEETAGGGTCCARSSDCPAHECATVTCAASSCLYALTPFASGCCADATTCPAGNACQTPACTQAVCGYTAKNEIGCCNNVVDCPGQLDCTVPVCTDNFCDMSCGIDGGAVPDARVPGADAGGTRDGGGGGTADGGGSKGDGGVLPDVAAHDGPGAPDGGTPAPVVGTLSGGGGCSIGPASPTGGGSVLAILFVSAVVAVTRRGRLRRGSAATRIALVLLFLGAGVARAQEKANSDATLFQPPATSGGVLDVDSAYVGPHLTLAASVYFDYASSPVILRDAAGNSLGSVVANQFNINSVALSLSLWKHLEIGAALPFILMQDVNNSLYPTANGLATSAIGDLRTDLKVFIGAVKIGRGEIGFGVAGEVTFPIGDSNAFFGEENFTFRPRAMVTLRTQRVELLLEAGLVVRNLRRLADIEIENQIQLGAGLRLHIHQGFGLAGTITGFVPYQGTTGEEKATPFELLAGPEYRFARYPVELIVAAGKGIDEGYGSPDFRLVAGIRYQPRTDLDRDGDGIPDSEDACPDELGTHANHGCPERDTDADGVMDIVDKCPTVPGPKENDGCPWPDRDHDGVLDKDDLCPDVAGLVENHGCPDKDTDGDGVVDRLDKCPTVPGPRENHGCPWADRDGDGVPDNEDACPTVYGPKENHGCPDSDRDGDGIPDRLDKCPDQPETFNGYQDEDGCPDKPPTVVFTGSSIEIREKIFFEFNKSRILPKSYLLLATVAKVLTLHPEVSRMRIEGHTDDVGSRDYNLKLSQDRADAVREHLIDIDGLDGARLTAQGFAFDRPIADNKTTKGRAKNRRVEFIVIEKNGQPLPPASAPAQH